MNHRAGRQSALYAKQYDPKMLFELEQKPVLTVNDLTLPCAQSHAP